MISFSDTVARVILLALGSGILVGAALALLVAVIARFMKTSATTRHVLWWIAFSAAALLPIASLTMSFQRVEHHRAQPQRAALRATPQTSNARAESRLRATFDTAKIATSMQSVDARTEAAPSVDWIAVATRTVRVISHVPGLPAVLVVTWLAVAALRIGLLVPGLVWLMGVKRAALPLDESIVRRLRRYRYGMRSGRATTISLSADVDVPIAVGFGKPTILLPIRVAENETIADLDQIVMHEHAHLNRYDDVTNLMQCLVERLFWFNPVIAFIGRRISLEREIACDDSVVAQTGRAHRYATCLWKLVESARLPARPVMAPGALLTPKQITRRIEKLLDSKRNALPRLSPASAIALGVFGASLIVLQAQRAPVIALEDAIAQPAPPAPVAAVAAAPAAVPAQVATTTPSLPAAPVIAPHAPLVPLSQLLLRPLAPLPRLAHLAPLAHPAPPAHPAHLAPLTHLAPLAPPAHLAQLAHLAPLAHHAGDSSEAMANAVVVAALDQSLGSVKRVRDLRVAAAAVLGTAMGIDIAKNISEGLVPPSEWAQIERSLERAKNEAKREIAMNDIPRNETALSMEGNRRNLPSFHRIEVDGSYDVIVRHGTRTYVDFQNDSYVSSHTTTEVDDGSLVIDQTGGSDNEREHKPILVYAPSIDAIAVDGSANVNVENASGERLAVNLSGSGDVTACGSVSNADLHLEGSGDANILGLAAATISIMSEGSGSVKLTAPQTLTMHLEGSGDVSVRGTPKHVSSRIEGSGSVIQL